MRYLISFIITLFSLSSYSQYYSVRFGANVGTTVNSQFLNESSLNYGADFGFFFGLDHFNIGVGLGNCIFSKYDYLGYKIRMDFAIIKLEANVFSSASYGFFIGGRLDYPLIINDSDYFDSVNHISETISKKKHLMPVFNIGYCWDFFEIFLSYKYYGYSNRYKFEIQSYNQPVNATETIRISIIQCGILFNHTR